MSTPKCPIHPQMSNHFLKRCYTFRNLPQAEKMDVMNTHGIINYVTDVDIITVSLENNRLTMKTVNLLRTVKFRLVV